MIIIGISGNVVKEPVLHHDEKNGHDYTYVRVATEPFGGYATRYFDVEVVRESAVACCKYLKPGKAVSVRADDMVEKGYIITKRDDKGNTIQEVRVNATLKYAKVQFGANKREMEDMGIKDEDIAENIAEVPAEQAESEQAAAANPLEDDALPF